jgi:type VI protein secretion system component Hcp
MFLVHESPHPTTTGENIQSMENNRNSGCTARGSKHEIQKVLIIQVIDPLTVSLTSYVGNGTILCDVALNWASLAQAKVQEFLELIIC